MSSAQGKGLRCSLRKEFAHINGYRDSGLPHIDHRSKLTSVVADSIRDIVAATGMRIVTTFLKSRYQMMSFEDQENWNQRKMASIALELADVISYSL